MRWNNYFEELEKIYRIEINQELRNNIKEHFGNNLDIYTEQDMYEQSRKLIQNYKDNYILYRYKKYYQYL